MVRPLKVGPLHVRPLDVRPQNVRCLYVTPLDVRRVYEDPWNMRSLDIRPGLNFNPNFFLFSLKAFYQIIFPIVFRASSIKLIEKKRIKLNWLLKLSFLNSNFTLTLGYLNSTLNNPALDVRPLN